MSELKLKKLTDMLKGNELDLSARGLISVPKDVVQLPRATHIDLGSNKISVLLPEICTMNRIVRLELGGNQLVVLPDNFGNLVSLQHLDLYNNRIEELPVSFSNLKNLRWLDLKRNPLESNLLKAAGNCGSERECKQAAGSVVAYMHTIKQTVEAQVSSEMKHDEREIVKNAANTLGNILICDLDGKLDLSFRALQRVPRNYIRLNIGGNRISQLPDHLGNMINLKRLEIGNNKIVTLPSSFERLVSLTYLDVSENPLETELYEIVGSCLTVTQCIKAATLIRNFMADRRCAEDQQILVPTMDVAVRPTMAVLDMGEGAVRDRHLAVGGGNPAQGNQVIGNQPVPVPFGTPVVFAIISLVVIWVMFVLFGVV